MKTELLRRTRYIIMRKDGAIFCGLARNYNFKHISEIGNTATKTYLSENKARASFIDSWYGSSEADFIKGKYKVVKVEEILEKIEEE